ncbi:MAG: hypothetical protein DMF60_06040 [Acidobacteria bacterium]|nr:MAG: hypothetical protein DMF60_06040 [Acidobacteriota bacterium]
MGHNNKKSFTGLALLAVVVVPAALGVRFYRSLPAEPLSVGIVVPQFDVEPVASATALPREGRRVLFFFSPSCPHCEETLLQFGQMRDAHPEWFSGDRGLKWIFISTAGKDETTAFAEAASWPVYYDAERRAMKSLRGVTVPYLVLVNEDGLVQYRHNGGRGLSQQEALIGMFYQTGTPPDLR